MFKLLFMSLAVFWFVEDWSYEMQTLFLVYYNLGLFFVALATRYDDMTQVHC